jgi:asparagine synthase (glutamine-hydrolysing)
MCGIAGVFGRPEGDVVATMLAALVHRGPDDGHQVSGRSFALGARRLSIVDLQGGRQPLSNEEGTVWAAQNGELYNFPEVRPRLEEAGHRFRTRCDTELLPHLYEEHGADAVLHLDGMFAVAIWDDARRVGLLARDRTGKKPLYYMEREGALYFASEIKALLRVPGVQRRIDLEALHHYLSLKHVPHPLTMFQGIRALPPGHRMVVVPGKPPAIERYWRPDASDLPPEAQPGEDEAIERYLELMRAAVRRRFMSDVPVGFFLSGGIDSSLSTALAAELAGGKIKTFTLTYEESSSTEGKAEDRRWARWVADRYATEHHEEVIRFENFPENIRRILACFDEPFAGVVSTYFLARLIARHVKVAVSGDGADELFGSYLSHRLAAPLAGLGEYRRTGDPSVIHPFEDRVDYLEELARHPDGAWRTRLFVFGEDEKAGLYTPDVAERMRGFSTNAYWQAVWAATTARDPVNRILDAEFGSLLPDQVLAFVDRLSMAHSLEVRTAFLDTKVVEYVARLPGRLKVRDGHTKYLLKKAALRYFPEEMVFRKKEGFLMPVARWLVEDLAGYVRETLHPDRLARHGFFDAGRVARLVDRLHEPGSDYTDANKVLSLIVFQEWYELYAC